MDLSFCTFSMRRKITKYIRKIPLLPQYEKGKINRTYSARRKEGWCAAVNFKCAHLRISLTHFEELLL